MTNYFQPLDLTVNGPAKQFLEGKFEEWYAKEVKRQVDNSMEVYSIDVNTKMSVLKPIHAHWLIGLYDYMYTFETRTIPSGRGLRLLGSIQSWSQKIRFRTLISYQV